MIVFAGRVRDPKRDSQRVSMALSAVAGGVWPGVNFLRLVGLCVILYFRVAFRIMLRSRL